MATKTILERIKKAEEDIEEVKSEFVDETQEWLRQGEIVRAISGELWEAENKLQALKDEYAKSKNADGTKQSTGKGRKERITSVDEGSAARGEEA